MENEVRKIYISGHRNPDVDSITSAYALAELYRLKGENRIEAICPGLLPARAAWIFRHFHLPPPVSRSDVYVGVSDLAAKDVPFVPASRTLHEALGILNHSGESALPVVEKDGAFVGMLDPAALLTQFLALSGAEKRLSFAGRTILSSEVKIAELLDADTFSGGGDRNLREYDVYVASSSAESFERQMDSLQGGRDVAIIAGDRPEIHRVVLSRRLPLLIITGSCRIEPEVVRLANSGGTTILRTIYDSAKTTRLLKFATPAGHAPLKTHGVELQVGDRAHDVRPLVLNSSDNIFPVLDANRHLMGVVRKRAFTAPPPFRMILVDHNESDQGIPGLEEIPVQEVVDHHRIAFRPTPEPIKYTADIVGSTCTIVTRLFRAAGLVPSPAIAGVLLSGLVADTLYFQSPTTTQDDRDTASWLEKISGETAKEIIEGLVSVASPLSSMKPREAVDSDRKTYHDCGYAFSLSQLEESNLILFRKNIGGLSEALREIRKEEKLDFTGLLVTDPVRGDSVLLFEGDVGVRRALPFRHDAEGIMLLPDVLSRKKQLLPQILSTLSTIRK